MAISSPNQTNPRERRRIVVRIWVAAVLMLAAAVLSAVSWMSDEEAVLVVTSSPPGAEVVLNLRPTDVRTNAYLSGLPADSFSVSLRLDGYRPIPPEQRIRLNSGDATRVTFILAPISRGDDRELPASNRTPYKWHWKKVRLNSDPPGAEIYIDDIATGLVTPASAVLDRGLHHLRAHWRNGAKAYKNLLVDPETSQPDVTFRAATYIQPEK
ncbi:MAG: PEGA domain-containing protein [Calditrichaeota bacterium]|nr:PEGA domain-containing protein [Calditrichota bacterium]MCB9366035.1 PEGA domain-containing protein [Calditrichota bacterium]MCB9391839.1 PEGA domain-containing protein [Calditrichota bacterium]